jgi:hypothetical protein
MTKRNIIAAVLLLGMAAAVHGQPISGSNPVNASTLINDLSCSTGDAYRLLSATQWECFTPGTATGGDEIRVEQGDDAGTFDGIDTTASFEDQGDINFVFTDGPAGGPDAVTGLVRDDAVEDNQDLLDLQDAAAADTCSGSEIVRRNSGDTAFECVEHWDTMTLLWYIGYLSNAQVKDTVATMNGLTCMQARVGPWHGQTNADNVVPLACTTTTAAVKRQFMSNYYTFPENAEVRLDNLICGFQDSSITTTTPDTLDFQPIWMRWGNQTPAGGNQNPAALTVTSAGTGTNTHYGEQTYTNRCGPGATGGDPTYVKCALSIIPKNPVFDDLLSGDFHATCQMFLSIQIP